MHSLHTDGPPCTSRTLREMESWLPIISFSNGTEEFYFIKLKQFSQKWKMNFGKSDALNSGGLFLIVLFSQKETLSKEIQNCTSEAEILYFLLLCFFYFRGREKKKENFAFSEWKALFKWQSIHVERARLNETLQFYLFLGTKSTFSSSHSHSPLPCFTRFSNSIAQLYHDTPRKKKPTLSQMSSLDMRNINWKSY